MKNKFSMLFVTILTILILGGCKNMPNKSPMKAYRLVLQNKINFFSVDSNKELNITQLNEAIAADSGVTVNVTKFATVDLERDGIPEIILCLAVNNNEGFGFEVLRYQDEMFYGYTLPYRAFFDVKVDGTFSFSSGVGDHGFGTIEFTDKGYTVNKITYSEASYDSENNQTFSFFVNHEAATEEDFLEAINAQNEKPEAMWFDFTDDNIKTLLADMK
ncbi:hypothetical protein [Acetivibrio mesophilus]|uniref:Lipoprotein n=1 Tax=Acetivibrio mesophilus TaxID=2487273 RepID=A0A4Q0I9H9_9FIRM|nr:hypothetical protein [Acetivibrio mesophilus]ODM26219.1 hypothetical protein A7W90_08270 [Clostridium sp. Bc-iso-3]RXE60727.1 hypothetical protein EFD62_02070 [Acetivibrio mesophilus]HHV28141.1 hypothetical protein [Clostridium sp.]